MPNFVRSQVNIEVAPNGAIIHDPTVSNTGNYFSYIIEALVPFPAEGYSFPQPCFRGGLFTVQNFARASGRSVHL